MDEFFSKILGDKKVVSTGELAALKTLQGRWMKALALLNASTDSAAKTAYAQHLRELSGAIAKGEDGSQEFSWEVWQQKFATRLAAAKMALHLICLESIPLASGVCEKFCLLANTQAVEQEQREAAQHAAFGVGYQNSALVLQLKRAAQMARGRIPVSAAFADTIITAAVAPITAANFSTFANIVASPTSFSWNDMQTAWGNLKKSPIHNALLDGEYLARIINVPTQFQRSGVEPGAAWSVFGWDNLALNTNWTGAGANVRGFFCNPQAVGAVAGLPLETRSATLAQTQFVVPGIGLSVQANCWFSLATRTMWCSYDTMFGAAVLDSTAGVLLTSQ